MAIVRWEEAVARHTKSPAAKVRPARPRGSGVERLSQLAERKLKTTCEELTEGLVEKARQGNVSCLKLLLELAARIPERPKKRPERDGPFSLETDDRPGPLPGHTPPMSGYAGPLPDPKEAEREAGLRQQEKQSLEYHAYLNQHFWWGRKSRRNMVMDVCTGNASGDKRLIP